MADTHRDQGLSSVVGRGQPEVQILKPIETKFILQSPCSVEFARHMKSGKGHLMVVATYENVEQESVENSQPAAATDQASTSYNRNGSLLLYEVVDDELNLLHSKRCVAGVEDAHFSPHDPSLLAAALSNGSISVFRLVLDNQPALEHRCTANLFPALTAVTSLAWHPRDKNILAVSLSTGSIALVRLSLVIDVVQLAVVRDAMSLHGHNNMTAWTVAFGEPGKYLGRPERGDFVLWSGGDDGTIQFSCVHHNEETGVVDFKQITSLPPIGRFHGAGVTALLPLPANAHSAGFNLVLTGSYDEHVRLVNSVGPKLFTELRLEDGVWNLRFLTDLSYVDRQKTQMRCLVLASCQRAGVYVLELKKWTDDKWSIRVLARFTEHQSLVYRADVQPHGPRSWPFAQRREYNCVSVSFYDKRICYWKFMDEADKTWRSKLMLAVKKVAVIEKMVRVLRK
ncbi:MAG: hypothetical protein M1816_003812 [Peltula sp. TS41687]|nr:MAG: hypothetical protein M1816_003812 [Peltula sp. TS41687]